MKQNKLIVQDIDVSFKTIDNKDFISLTDIARSKSTIENVEVIRVLLTNKIKKYLNLC